MTEDNNGSDIETRRKRLKFRAWHRGTRELDLLVGGFADRHLDIFSDRQLNLFEDILSYADPDLYNWISGREPVPQDAVNDVMQLLTNFTLAQAKK